MRKEGKLLKGNQMKKTKERRGTREELMRLTASQETKSTTCETRVIDGWVQQKSYFKMEKSSLYAMELSGSKFPLTDYVKPEIESSCPLVKLTIRYNKKKSPETRMRPMKQLRA